MKQKKKQPQKKPINVQLSKEDLTELLMVLKNFMSEEISVRDKRLIVNQFEMDKRITTLEVVENSHRKEIHRLKQHCLHDDKLDCIHYSGVTGAFLHIVYKCKLCKREYQTSWAFLSRKERKGLRKLGVKI